MFQYRSYPSQNAVGVLLLILLTASQACSQHVTLPKEVKGEPGAWIVIVPDEKDGGEVKWKVSKGLTLVPLDKLFPGKKAAGIVVQAPKGIYEVWAWNAKGDVASELSVCIVNIGNAPTPGPDPGPDPEPDPKPLPGQIKDLRVLILYETNQLIPVEQDLILRGVPFRTLLNSKCGVDPNRADWKAWRIYDKDIALTGARGFWKENMQRPPSTPFIYLFDGDKLVHSQPLPETSAEAQTLINRFVSPKTHNHTPMMKKAG